MKMWHMHDRTTPEQAEINRGRSNNGTLSKVENTTPPNDDYDVYTSMARGGMVHDTSQSHYGAVGPCQCSDGSDDGCVCGMAGA